MIAEQVQRKGSRIGATIRALIRARITAGVITILPILITVWVVRLVFVWMRDASQWAVLMVLDSKWFQQYIWQVQLPEGQPHEIEAILQQYPLLYWIIAVFSVFLTIFVLYMIGLFAANIFGRRIIAAMENLLERVPLIKTIYRGLKQILASLAGDQTQSFRRAALIPFPHEKMRCVGFVTNIFKDSVTGEELCSVFIATTPNPTTGYLQVLKRSEITELNWSVEEAIRCVMSGGILKPEFLTIVPNKNLPDDLPDGVGPEPLLSETTDLQTPDQPADSRPAE